MAATRMEIAVLRACRDANIVQFQVSLFWCWLGFDWCSLPSVGLQPQTL